MTLPSSVLPTAALSRRPESKCDCNSSQLLSIGNPNGQTSLNINQLKPCSFAIVMISRLFLYCSIPGMFNADAERWPRPKTASLIGICFRHDLISDTMPFRFQENASPPGEMARTCGSLLSLIDLLNRPYAMAFAHPI